MKLKSVTDIQMGYSFRSRLEPEDDGDVAVIQMKDLLDDNTVSCENAIRVYMDSIKETHLVQKGDLVFRYGIIEPPHPLGMKTILFDAFHFEVGLANGSEHVSYLYGFRSLSAFLCRPV